MIKFIIYPARYFFALRAFRYTVAKGEEKSCDSAADLVGGSHVSNELLLLIRVDEDAVIVVIGDIPEEERLLREGQQSLLHSRDCHHRGAVDVYDTPQIRTGGVESGVKCEASHIHSKVCRASVYHSTLDIITYFILFTISSKIMQFSIDSNYVTGSIFCNMFDKIKVLINFHSH